MELYGAILKSALAYTPLMLHLMTMFAKNDFFKELLLIDIFKQMGILLLKSYWQYSSVFQTMEL